MKKIAQIDADKQMQRYVDKYLEKEKSRLEGAKKTRKSFYARVVRVISAKTDRGRRETQP